MQTYSGDSIAQAEAILEWEEMGYRPQGSYLSSFKSENFAFFSKKGGNEVKLIEKVKTKGRRKEKVKLGFDGGSGSDNYSESRELVVKEVERLPSAVRRQHKDLRVQLKYLLSTGNVFIHYYINQVRDGSMVTPQMEAAKLNIDFDGVIPDEVNAVVINALKNPLSTASGNYSLSTLRSYCLGGRVAGSTSFYSCLLSEG
ncbi:hypothetical protein BVC80_1745g20 [Macleaya cordata]|uniref:Uncharacterized protein n=1 Tax=Macleaya cordata TaxID=56857 RepID=A0A200QKS4_MACCD|nr:hypothetical protein BVC80_1745g20 [Macleaya cordata]